MLDYIKHRQKQWEKKIQRAAELEAKKEAARVAKMESAAEAPDEVEAREQEEFSAHKKLLLEQQETERFRQNSARIRSEDWDEMSEWLRENQKQHAVELEAKKEAVRVAELEAKKEAARVVKMEAEAREQKEIAARKKLLLEQQEAERLRQKHIQRKEKLAEQKWNEQLDTLLAQIMARAQEDAKLEEIRIIIQNREPSLQELDWDSWLSDPLNQKLADLDFGRAMEMFKRDNLMAKRRKRRGGKKKPPPVDNYSLTFTGNGASGADDYVTTDFNPDDYDLNLGFTVSYWVRPDEIGNTLFAFCRKYSNNERFVFGINRKRQSYFGIGQSQGVKEWRDGAGDGGEMDVPLEESLLKQAGKYWDLRYDGMWYHMAVTYDDRSDTSSGADRKIYVNGVLRQTDNINWSSTGSSFTDDGMMFGGRNLRTSGASKYNNGWACALDQVAIFNTAKDAAWVASVYNTGQKKLDLSNESGLVGYWKFDEGKGTTVKDHSGNGNHGTFAPIGTNPGGIVTTAYPTWEYLGRVVTS